VAARARGVVGSTATVTDVEEGRRIAASSLTAVDLAGLTRVELGFALVLVAGGCGLLVALDLAERRRGFATARALGGRKRQVAAFIRSEVGFVVVVGALWAVVVGGVVGEMLVKVLTGVFDPPPAHLALPGAYLAVLGAVALVAGVVASETAVSGTRRSVVETMRDL